MIDSLAPLPAPIEPVLTEGQTNKPINADHKPDLLDFYAVVGKDTITLSPMTGNYLLIFQQWRFKYLSNIIIDVSTRDSQLDILSNCQTINLILSVQRNFIMFYSNQDSYIVI